MCGVFGIFGSEEAAKLTYLGLYALQHRGEESAGIASFNGERLRYKKGKGLVGDVFDEEKLNSLTGYIAVGHNRYSTTGSSITENVQPIMVNHKRTPVVIAHNGNFTNTAELYQKLENTGAIFHTSMDSEILVHLLARAKKKDFRENLISSLKKIKGAYSIVSMIGENLIGVRDPLGFKPLCIGKLYDNNLQDTYIITSETCALDLIGAEYIRDVEPGEMVVINDQGIESIRFSPKKKKKALCIFEYIYFARPDGNIFGHNVYLTRKNLGRALSKESPVKEADFVMPIPDSGSYAAAGFSEESKKPVEQGVMRNHYIGRTFIQPSQFVRDFKVKIKLNPIKEVLKGKKIVAVDDSIVRGTTSRARVKTLRKAGAKEIHMRISCPPIKFPCCYGIDFPTNKELIAHQKSVKEIEEFIGVDSLAYLSLKGMLQSMPLKATSFCTACFTGDYPICPPKALSKKILEK
ncbi:amidophosphoribosyltransferase [Candidatus Auribacterota bacterium]